MNSEQEIQYLLLESTQCLLLIGTYVYPKLHLSVEVKAIVEFSVQLLRLTL